MVKSKLARAALVAGASAALVVGMSPSAQAITDKTLYLPYDRGYMHFHDDGDVFSICDTKADGYGVSGNVQNATITNMFTIDDGGDAGCDKKPYNVGIGSVRMLAWWHGDLIGHYSDWFRE
ncbi:hypothetical protein [Streptomyces sp. NPDC059781]|uniref:hypothetical protein n=1 Tax=unclassified Streptomyces TaxID=2593676 RepID=UPI003648C5BF